jgi:5-formyltetrahydrofolate cyclo-ligase
MAREAALDAEYLVRSDAGIAPRLFALPEFEDARTVLFFYSVGHEPDTHLLIERALEIGKTVALPESRANGIMVARRITSLGELVPGKYGIPAPTADMPEIAPEEFDFVVVPALAYDLGGYRLGRGGGYYDRYLPQTRAFKCGAARERMFFPRVAREEHDVRVNCVVTETKVWRFSRPKSE